MADKSLNASVKLWIDGKEIPNTVNAITKEMRKLQREQKNMTIGSQEYVEQTKKIQELNGILAEHKRQLKGVSEETSSLSKKMGEILKLGFGTLLGNVFTDLKDKIAAAVTESVKLAESAEGIELAFQRIDQPGLLDNLRASTHNALSDITLMTQAVKFKDFNLPIEQMGTYLAYAQQKAKDTGQDLSYLVDSIVTGLGRQSLPILDNLGLSATEIREEMKSTGDMFSAVANIIQKNMAESGEYVETAADRAAQAEARLENAQLELGKALLPLKESAGGIFSTIQVSAINLFKVLVEHRATVLALVAAFGMLTIARNRDVIAAKLQVFWNDKLVKSFKAIKAAMATNPWTAVVLVATALVGVVIDLTRRMKEAKDVHDEMAEAQKEAEVEGRKEVATLERLYKATQDANRPISERKMYIAELRKQFPAYFKDLSDEEVLAGKAANAYQKLANELIATAKARAYQKRIDKLAEENADLEVALDSELDWLIANQGEYNRRKANRHKGVSTAEYATPGAAATSYQERNGFINEYERREDRVLQKQDQIRKNEQKMEALSSKALTPNVSTEPVYTPTSTPSRATVSGASAPPPTTDPETERLKKIKADQLAIEQEYVAKRNALMQQYVADAEMTSEELQVHLENLEMDRLQEELNILNLKESEKNKVMQEMLELRKTWKEREVEQQQALEEQELENIRSHLEKAAEEQEEALRRMEEQEKERAQLILDVAQQFGSSFGDMMGKFFENGELQFGEFLKNILKLTIDALEKTMIAAIAERTIKNVASLGLIGLGKAAAEIAAITAAFETAKGLVGSFAVGGFTGRGNWNEPRGIVHANEFVANRHALANPTVMPVLSLIDAAQKTGNVANLNSADIASVLPPHNPSSFIPGLSVPGGTAAGSHLVSALTAQLAAMAKTNRMLQQRLQQPIIAETYATGKRGVNEAQTLLQKMKSNVARQ